MVDVFGRQRGVRHQSAPSAVALTDEALTVPDENSIPALTHLHRGCCRRDRGDERVCGAAPANITSPPWSHSISQSALTVTSATMNGCRSEVNAIGAVDVSPFGGFRQRSVLGPAVRVKYSIHCGSEKSGGRFNVVKEELSGGISAI